MLTAETIQSMGRKNVSANADLTMQRTKEVLKAAKRKQQSEIDALTGLKRVSVNRVYATGTITAKVAVAIGQVLNVNPFYLTGEVEERGAYTNDVLVSFLTTKGHPKLAKAVVKKQKDAGTAAEPVNAADAPAKSETAPLFPAAFSKSTEMDAAAADLSVEDAQFLVAALYIRAKAGGNAAQHLELIKRTLLL